MSGIKLKDCPFCGSKDGNFPIVNFHKETKSHDKHFTVVCQYCAAEPNYYACSENQAIEAWNNRAEPSDDDICTRLTKIELMVRLIKNQLQIK